MNQYEHLKVEWTVRHGSYVNAFHTFFKSLNNFHKHLKRKQLGGFWKDPKYGYISGYLLLKFNLNSCKQIWCNGKVWKQCTIFIFPLFNILQLTLHFSLLTIIDVFSWPNKVWNNVHLWARFHSTRYSDVFFKRGIRWRMCRCFRYVYHV